MTGLRAPFPYFGGKRAAAPLVWSLLGDVGGYVEPFSGSAAVLLARPPVTGRRVETINDADGLLINAWRAIRYAPDVVAGHLQGLVSEVEYHAKLAYMKLVDLVPRLEGDPEWHDPKLAAWWLDVSASAIGNPFDDGPWHRVQDEHGTWRLVRGDAGQGVNRKLPHLGDAGRGVNRKLPHLGDAGRGVNWKLPHLGDAGQGVRRELPHLGNAGQGVNRGLSRLGGVGEGVTDYLHALSARLAHVRITCGDWTRVVTPAVIGATAGCPHVGVFLDPPYSRGNDLYHTTSAGLDAQVREWCKTADPELRIVIAGYDDDHDELLHHGWTKHVGKATGGSGYTKGQLVSTSRERLWASPACLTNDTLFDLMEVAL